MTAIHNNMNASSVSSATTSEHSFSVTSSAAPANLSVIDPMNRTGKITLPMHLVSDTRGLADHFLQQQGYQTGGPRDLSLCLLFQNGRCHAGDRCNQIHAAPTYVSELRARAAAGNCCAAHGDMQSASYLHAGPAAMVVVYDANGHEETLPLSSFGRTGALDAVLHKAKQYGTLPRVNRSRACRLHQQRRCKFGQDCKNIHMCNGAGQRAAVATPPPAAVAVSARRLPPFEPRKHFDCNSSASSNFGVEHIASGERTPSDDCCELSIRSTAPPLLCADLLEASTHGSRQQKKATPLALTDMWSTEFSKLDMTERSDINVFANALEGCDPSPLMSC